MASVLLQRFEILFQSLTNKITNQLLTPALPQPHTRTTPIEKAVNANYDVINCIGHGAVGTVYQVNDRHRHRLQAVKVVRKSDLRTEYAKKCVTQELFALNTLRHRNILHFHHSHHDDEFIYIATEYCSKGDLLALLRRSSIPLTMSRALRIMRQVFIALDYIHERGISHRDIKLENILLATNGTVRLADFGLVHSDSSIGKRETAHDFCGTLDYAAPEVLHRDAYIPRFADMWSSGVTLFVLLTRQKPFDTSSWRDCSMPKIREQASLVLNNNRLGPVGTPCRSLVQGLLSANPTERISASEAVKLCDEGLKVRREP